MENRHEQPGFLEKLRENRRLFRWVTGGLIIFWLLSVCIHQSLGFRVKGWAYVGFYLGFGAINLEIQDPDIPESDFVVDQPDFLVLKEVLRSWSGDAPAILPLAGNGFWRLGDLYNFSVPTGGILCLWLTLACIAELKARASTDTPGEGSLNRTPYSGRRLRILAGITAGLALAVCILAIRGKERTFANYCMRNQEAIQNIINSHNIPANWRDMFGKSGLLDARYAFCPWGEPYELSPDLPSWGRPSARCHHPGHEKIHEWLYKRGRTGAGR